MILAYKWLFFKYTTAGIEIIAMGTFIIENFFKKEFLLTFNLKRIIVTDELGIKTNNAERVFDD